MKSIFILTVLFGLITIIIIHIKNFEPITQLLYTVSEDAIRQCKIFNENSTTKKGGFASQYYQDYILWESIFKKQSHQTRFYVDLAAAYPEQISNTWFFDQCNRWDGLCIEADQDRIPELESKRSCKIIPTCIFSSHQKMTYQKIKGQGEISGLKGMNKLERFPENEREEYEMECRTLEEVFREYGVNHVDYFALDCEGCELNAIKSIDFTKVVIDVFTVEVERESEVDRILKENGFEPIIRMFEDVFYIHKSREDYKKNMRTWLDKIDIDPIVKQYAEMI